MLKKRNSSRNFCASSKNTKPAKDFSILQKLIEKKDLKAPEVEEIMNAMMKGEMSEISMAAFLTALRAKGETPEEIAACAKIMRKNATLIHPKVKTLVDTCGTGGDHSNTFNISTTAAFVVAGAGVKVAKHGNKAASSKCGSADVLEALGIKVDMTPKSVEKCIERVGIGFLFAPKFHAAMRYIAPVRKEMKIRTVFNILGPLTNPAGAKHQVIGVFDPNLTEPMAKVLKILEAKHAMVVHGDGLDEITTTGMTRISELKNEKIRNYTISPENYCLAKSTLKYLKGGDSEKNARITQEILQGKKGPKRDIVVINSAAALIVADRVKNFHEGIILAQKSIDSGEALKKLEALRKFTFEAE